jgi:hypothetical protein
VTSEDRIRELCAHAVAAENDDEALNRIISQLREVIHELRIATEYPSRKNGSRRLC